MEITQYQREELLCGKNYFVPATKMAKRLNLSLDLVRKYKSTITSKIIFADEDAYWRRSEWSKRKTKTLV